MASRASLLAWRSPWTEEPGRLPSLGSQRVGRDEAPSHHHHCSPFYFCVVGCNFCGFPNVSVVKNLPAAQESQETRVWFLGMEDPLEEEMATHCTILAGIIPWAEEPGRLQSIGLQRVGHDWVHTHEVSSYGWVKKVVSWDGIYSWWRLLK